MAFVGAASIGEAIVSAILPGIGTLVGGVADLIASAMFHTAVNDASNHSILRLDTHFP